VERRERGGEWLKVNNYPTPNTTFTVQDLHEGSRYEFRVIAVNEAGSGKPSKPTEPITAGYQRRKCISIYPCASIFIIFLKFNFDCQFFII